MLKGSDLRASFMSKLNYCLGRDLPLSANNDGMGKCSDFSVREKNFPYRKNIFVTVAV